MKIGAFSIILDMNNSVLLCKRTDNFLWNLPGGKVEEEESPWQAAIRENLEETGLLTSIERLIAIYHKPKANELVFLFKANILSGELTTGNESLELQFFDKEKLPEDLISKHKDRILDFFYADTDKNVLLV